MGLVKRFRPDTGRNHTATETRDISPGLQALASQRGLGWVRIDGTQDGDGFWRLQWKSATGRGYIIQTRRFERYCKVVMLAIKQRKPVAQALKSGVESGSDDERSPEANSSQMAV